MKQNNLDLQIRQRIDALLGDISVLVKSTALNAVRNALGAVETTAHTASSALAPAQARTAQAAAAKRRAKGGKRTSEEVNALAVDILGYIKNNAGQRLEQIGNSMQTATKDMKLPIQKLLSTREIRTEGAKRGTKYFATSATGKPARTMSAKSRTKTVKTKSRKKA